MKALFVLTFAVIFAIMLRQTVSNTDRMRADVEKDCKAVCDDIGLDNNYVVKTGVFTYKCACKYRPVVPVQRKR